MKPLLAHVYEPHRVTYPCYVQPKLNGIRALYQMGRFQSRDEQPFPPGLLDHLAKPLSDIFDPSVILDGELYVHGWPLQRINAAVTPVRQEPTEDTVKVEYHVFDVVDFSQQFIDRWQVAAAYDQDCLLTKFPRGAYAVTTMIANSEAEANANYAAWVADGYEGMMYRLGDCPYTVPKQEWKHPWSTTIPKPRSGKLSDQDNRVWHLLKRKDWQDDEFTCVGIEEGEGKYKGTLGSFICRARPPAAFPYNSFSVGSGISDAQRDHYFVNPPLGQKIKVKYLVLSSSGIPLNPTILAIL